MPIDPSGTAPGLVDAEVVKEKVHVRCRNPNCDSILAFAIKVAGGNPANRMFQCCECKRTWSVSVGGVIEL